MDRWTEERTVFSDVHTHPLWLLSRPTCESRRHCVDVMNSLSQRARSGTVLFGGYEGVRYLQRVVTVFYDQVPSFSTFFVVNPRRPQKPSFEVLHQHRSNSRSRHGEIADYFGGLEEVNRSCLLHHDFGGNQHA